MNNLNILQANVQSYRKNKDEIEHIIKMEKINIACIQETWIKEKDNTKITGYNIITENREEGYGGSAIIRKKGMKFKQIKIRNRIKTYK